MWDNGKNVWIRDKKSKLTMWKKIKEKNKIIVKNTNWVNLLEHINKSH